MKQKKILFTLAFLCLQTTQSLFAYDLEVDGLRYTIITSSTAEFAGVNPDYEGEVIIPEYVSYSGKQLSVNTIGEYAFQFYNAPFLRIPEHITKIKNAAFYEAQIDSLHFENSDNSIDLSNTINRGPSLSYSNLGSVYIGRKINRTDYNSNAKGPFYCSSVKKVYLGKTCELASKLFQSCGKLEKVIVKEGSYITYIGDDCFSYCHQLKTIDLKNGLETISYRAFLGCESLDSIYFPSTVTAIRSNAFSEAKNIKTVVSASVSPVAIAETAFPGIVYMSATLYVPTGTKTKYETTEGWKEFVNIREIGQEESFSLNAYCNKGGSLNINGQTISNQVLSVGVSRNQSITISITPDDGYYIKSVTLNGRDVKDDLYNNTYTIAQIKEDIDFRVEFAKVATFLSLKQPTGSMDIVVKEGESQTIRLIPESGYAIHSVTYNGKDVTNQLAEDNTFVTPEITDNSVLYVIYENGDNPPVSHAKYLTIKHSENGVVKQKITLGRSYTYKISPVSGQKLTALYFNGVDVSSEIKGGKYTTPVLNDNATLEVEFEAE